MKTISFELSGPLHGGANEAVIRMLISIGKSVVRIIPYYIRILIMCP